MITHATIHFNDTGTPVADAFDDVYFSNEDGLAESDFVFYQHNQIDERLKSHPRKHFVIAETGFGTGLNFLNAWQRFTQCADKKAERLHFISFEKFPIRKVDLSKALNNWPQLSQYAEQLLAQYPDALPGCHRLHFGKVTLDLWIGDVKDSLAQLNYGSAGLVDAWFLDGFAPSKNPDMWQQSLFDAMAHLGREQATFATFTAAGFVRRGLKDAGFEVKKVKGYGRKREMIVGQLTAPTAQANCPAPYQRQARALNKVAIIGGGIASSLLLHRLSARNIAATLFCADGDLAQGASHNNQGALYPHLQADVSPSSEFFAHSFAYARRLYDQLLSEGFTFDHQWCGVLLQGVKDEMRKRHANLVAKDNWPNWLIHKVDADQASELAAIDIPYSGLFIPKGGWLSPPQLVQALADAACKEVAHELNFNTPIRSLSQQDGQWYLEGEQQTYGPFDDIFICMGEHSDSLLPGQGLALQSVRGQVSHLENSSASSKLNTVLCHKGYFTPSSQGAHCMGATFTKDTKERDIRAEDNDTNWQQFADFYGECDWTEELGTVTGAKAAIRATLSDHLPLFGQYAQDHEYMKAFPQLGVGVWQQAEPLQHEFSGLHLFTGLGARGLCTAPICAEALVASLCDEPLPLSLRVDQALHPARFIIRGLKRGQIT
ncbi:bifunctional tRNA (5-methylaminomethyl-2-thiouridine)(34)-methyltransferase MnmD/FAD-dependent 5-carboxymethylaminomethyl-2-thiouridine(34) oxidoreductase MnmC [Pseudoalteromonas sp. T1lg76]|uniref:bifunctional tRNA (5-methylaminomethyl-2-thiouridine)(34)-methyltransferase MnmD/FAD-dependent 5-carboxymethylaminomethyl-2-thiouridine(34) oxidoreductase MnmC n=1 Tax=Pseudoalteromonas sp. T1lg76 TaxID=2077103 RepID=UPI000CF63FCE|nr:bifunctional tRNA (5-methylaminomethyl-2-thiouridine)(34)-methyltransferase MnmD/FAD-dependent 5-carboxymethylaminomethyl-2-thiouridine(34) oxidoreductase MnmC [Pseudoalteromonas sp. T1lg76]